MRKRGSPWLSSIKGQPPSSLLCRHTIRRLHCLSILPRPSDLVASFYLYSTMHLFKAAAVSLETCSLWTTALAAATAVPNSWSSVLAKRHQRGRHDDCPQVHRGSFIINQYQLYPENADWDEDSCLVYFGWVSPIWFALTLTTFRASLSKFHLLTKQVPLECHGCHLRSLH